MSIQSPPTPTASTVGPCHTVIQISRTRPALEVYSAPALTASAVGPCPSIIQSTCSRTLRRRKFTQHHRTTRPTLYSTESTLNKTFYFIPCISKADKSHSVCSEKKSYFFTVANRGCFDNLGLNFFQKRSGMHCSCLTLRLGSTHVK